MVKTFQKSWKFCYFGNMFSYYGGAPEAVSERTGSA